MKKTLLSLLAVAAVAVSVNAEPRFGMVAYTTQGIGQFQPGIIVVDEQYTASLSFGSSTTEQAASATQSSFTLGANYKVGLDANNSATFGLAYATQSGDGIETINNLQVLAGIERNLGNNLLLTLEAVVYQTGKNHLTGGVETKTSGFLNGGRFGLAYLL